MHPTQGISKVESIRDTKVGLISAASAACKRSGIDAQFDKHSDIEPCICPRMRYFID